MSKTLKVMSIIGIVLASICYFFQIIEDASYNYYASAGWGVIAIMYLLAFSIVGLVQHSRNTK